MTAYYIDYAYGDNLNAGTSTGAPWKHCPGDANSTGNAAACVLTSGDVVNFKGGVVYRGEITCNRSGAAGNSITYQTAPSWGTGKAIIEGADVWSPTWTQCTSAAECGGNANYANIWWATAPTGFSLFVPIYEDGEFVWIAQSPVPTEPIFFNRWQYFKAVPYAQVTTTTVTDSEVFTQADSNFWVGHYVLVRESGNAVVYKQITAFNPATDTISFSTISNGVYLSDTNSYSVAGHPFLISGAGQMGFEGGKVFLWASTGTPADHTYTVGSRTCGFMTTTCENVVIDGFLIRGQYALIPDGGEGCGVLARTWGNTSNNVTIQNCEITRLRSMCRSGAIQLFAGTNYTVDNCNIHHCQANSGVISSIAEIAVNGCTIEYIGYAGIWFMDVVGGRITNNVLQNILGTHANGISVYKAVRTGGSENVLVFNNRVVTSGSNISFTSQNSTNVWVIGNLFDGSGSANPVDDWGGMTGSNYFIGNTIVRPSAMNYFGSTSWVFRNNIVDTLGWETMPTDRQYNLYCQYGWQQDSQYGWSLGTGEIYNENTGAIFTDYANGDFTLKSGSPAISAGMDVSAYYPTTLFPDIDFTQDLNGATRSGFDLGAYEYATGGGVEEEDPPTSNGGVLVLAVTGGGYLALGVSV